MKFSLKTIAAALALAAAASGANAAIDNGAGGNGELFFNLSSASGSYTRDLGFTIDSFQAALAGSGSINLSWTADATLNTWLSQQTSTVELNLFAVDSNLDRRFITTYSSPLPTTTQKNDVIRNSVTSVQSFLANVNPSLPMGIDSAAFDTASKGYAGQKNTAGNTFNDKVYNQLNFATTANVYEANSVGGISLIAGAQQQLMRIDAKAGGTLASVYTPYADGGNAVNVYFDANNTLHIAAVPEPSEYALLLAGLGLMGAVARRRKNDRA
jgi:hypothetical protein